MTERSKRTKDRLAGLVMFLTVAVIVIAVILLGCAAYMRFGFWGLAGTYVGAIWWAMAFRWAWVRRGHPDFDLFGD